MYIFFLHLCISQILHVIEVNFFIKKIAGSTHYCSFLQCSSLSYVASIFRLESLWP